MLIASNVSKIYGMQYAVDNVTLHLKKGMSLGIVGSNGAGKSTLLKILANVIKPSSGKVEIFGSVASVLDIGSGFHPELSGIENVKMILSLYGIKQNSKIIAEIFDFSGLEKQFENVSVKHYSNGMYLRLAFSIIRHIEADILLIDEVMGVGDLEFQIISRQVIQNLLNSNKSIITISHISNEILQNCNHFLVLEKGKVIADNNDPNVVYDYMRKSIELAARKDVNYKQIPLQSVLWTENEIPANDDYAISCVRVYNAQNEESKQILVEYPINITISYISKIHYRLDVIIKIFDSHGGLILTLSPLRGGVMSKSETPGKYSTTCTIPKNIFNMGSFFVELIFIKNLETVSGTHSNILKFITETNSSDFNLRQYVTRVPGGLAPLFEWSNTKN